jgi:hypothetical protein
MTTPLPDARYPFGLRDVKLYPFLDQQGTLLAEEGFDLPAAQTYSFADAADSVDLRGDDDLIASANTGSQVNWTLEAGGISLACWAVLTGGQLIETGAAPNRVTTLRRCSDDKRPYFQVRGLSMNENGGDTVGIVYRAKCNGDISGSFAEGAFFVTSADGVGMPIPGTKLLYDFVQHETRTFLSLTSEAVPIVAPKNIMAVPLTATSARVIWEPVTTYTGYHLQTSIDAGVTWVAVASDPTDATKDLTGLTADSDYLVRVAGKIGTDVGTYSPPVAFSTPA